MFRPTSCGHPHEMHILVIGPLCGTDKCIQNLYTGLVGKPIRSSLATPRNRREDNIKVHIREQFRRTGNMVVCCGNIAHIIELPGYIK
jgi:hypothetical protein